jgi:hypothetical protein
VSTAWVGRAERPCPNCGYVTKHAPDECPARLTLLEHKEQEQQIKAMAYDDPGPSSNWRTK